MSAGGAFGGARGYQPRAPEKGVFPLDHFGECKEAMSCRCTLRRFKVKERYLACLKERGQVAEECRTIAKEYLECRMQRNLMAQQDLEDLGFRKAQAQQQQH